MSKLEKAIFTLQRMEIHDDESPKLDARIGLLISILYLCLILSIPLGRLSMLIWMALYPIVASAWLGLNFTRIFIQSLIVLPIVIIIGVFNPVYETSEVFRIHGISISEGWISFMSIILRGLLAMQCLLILIESNGFLGLCRGLSKLGVPKFLTEQLQFVFRYLIVLMEEALSMKRARESRGYGRKRFPLKIWGTMIGQLFLRAIDRCERISKAMEARGFTGRLPDYRGKKVKISANSWIFLMTWLVILPLLRIFDMSGLFFH